MPSLFAPSELLAIVFDAPCPIRAARPAPQNDGEVFCRCSSASGFRPANCRSRTCECIPIPVLKTSLILLVSCPMRGRFLEAILQRTERELAGPGRPGTVDGLVVGGALGGAAPSLGRARFTLPREVGSPPASRVPIGALAPPTAPSPRAVREELANLGRIAPRECGSVAV